MTKSCKKNGETYSCGSATGYIKGIIETLDGVYVCPQQKINNGKIFDAVEFFLEKNSENQEKSRLNAVIEALTKKWPCSELKNQQRNRNE